MKRTRGDLAFDIFNYALMGAMLVIFIYPLYYTVIASVSEPSYAATGKVALFPVGFTLDAYRNVVRNSDIWVGYRNTILYTLFGTFLSICVTLPTAYVLSKRNLFGRAFFSWFFLFTMYFSGGLVPTYLLVRDLKLVNQPYTMAVLGAFSVFNMVVTRIYYQTSIPETLFEAATIDGSGDFGKFFKIALPLSAPITAVMALYYGVAVWNNFFTALIYVTNKRFFPLQLVLRNIILENQVALQSVDIGPVSDETLSFLARQVYMVETMKYAIIFIASAPLLVAYPFVQKYFVKGVMIGSLKG
jgi:putative aldouronate transport system permease protein